MLFKKVLLGVIAASAPICVVSSNAAGVGKDADYVYVETNIKTANGNSILAYRRAQNGQLTQLQGSPFLTGGSGIQFTGVNAGPPDSDQDIIANPDHTLLFAVNSGSDTIAVFHINHDGSLEPIKGSPFPSGGNDPVSLDLVGDTLFIVNKSDDPGRTLASLPNYTTLHVLNDGTLTPFDDKQNDTTRSYQSTVYVAKGSSPTQVHAVPGTNLIFGTDFSAGLIQRFEYNFNGGIKQFPPLALPAREYTAATTSRLPLGVWHHPYLPLIYVGFVTDAKLGVYRYDFDGKVKFLRAAPNSGAAICWIRTNRSGTRLYTSNTISNSVSVYDITQAENPVQIQEFPLLDKGNVLQFSLSTDERSLYALSSRGDATIPEGQGNELHSLSVGDDGRLTEALAPIRYTLPNDTRPQGVAVIAQ